MSLLDKDLEPITVYPDIDGVDYNDNPTVVPDLENGVEVWVRWKTPDTTEAVVEGQHVTTVARVLTRSELPAGPFSVVEARGRLWDVQGDVGRKNRSAATQHNAMTLVAQTPGPRHGG
ncbi:MULTISPECIES: hypothetical protein [unclassified Aeromicrobium]|uniref:hypothetical protein n=1 Tax=unclassified Aeromicrobium TaxID=2633570 RepID=UPI00288A54F1|nr:MULTISPECIES: hypothetical protein [unclassified Aeromicrobium]